MSVVRPLLIVLGPSGAGKSSLLKGLFKKYPNSFGFSVSHTTRAPRPGEQSGVDYHFVNTAEMERLRQEGAFLESALVYGNHYGTSLAAVNTVTSSGRTCVLDVDVQGCQSVLAYRPAITSRVLCVRPPSLQVLEQRLRARSTETPESLKLRLEIAQREWPMYLSAAWIHKTVINDDLTEAGAELERCVRSWGMIADNGMWCAVTKGDC